MMMMMETKVIFISHSNTYFSLSLCRRWVHKGGEESNRLLTHPLISSNPFKIALFRDFFLDGLKVRPAARLEFKNTQKKCQNPTPVSRTVYVHLSRRII